MSWTAVARWLERLRALDAARFDTGLSPEGAREAWRAALDALDAATLQQLAARGERAPQRTAFIAASTVFTAPIEWIAVQLGRGGAVVLKHPQARVGAAEALVREAVAEGLPLTRTHARDAWRGADLVIAMGSDASMQALEASLPVATRFLPHGHRFSAAWVTGAPLPPDPLVPEGFGDTAWDGIAADLALYDGRGCFSPQVVFTPLALEAAGPALAAAMARARARWPLGEVAPEEGAQLRARLALARVTGAVWGGPGAWVAALPAARWTPGALPGLVALVQVPRAEEAQAALAPWGPALSVLATDAPGEVWFEARACRPGRAQRPPVVRLHDGRDWLAESRA